MSETPIAYSPIAPTGRTRIESGWSVTRTGGGADLTISDHTPLAKVQVKATHNGELAAALGVPFGRAGRHEVVPGLIIGSGPGEWLILGPPGSAPGLVADIELLAETLSGELVTVLDQTHGRALIRLTGERVTEALAKVCAIDLREDATPNGSAFRTSVAKLVTDAVRDDQGGTPSFLLHCERSSGQYLFDALLDAGSEFGMVTDGFTAPGIRGSEEMRHGVPE